jgi:8-oxo-dGTP pyrophosphatase MutT (NUDIX family)
VLILLYQGVGGMSFPVTLRSQRVLHHKGQISLPGGLQEVGDASLADTALRETQEEIGIGPSHIRLLGRLTPVYVASSNSNVYPYVGFYSTAPDFSPNPDEVTEIIEMSFDTLLDPTHREEEYRQIRGRRVKVPFIWLGEHKIWGATAMILGEFATILSSTPELVPTPNHPAC